MRPSSALVPTFGAAASHVALATRRTWGRPLQLLLISVVATAVALGCRTRNQNDDGVTDTNTNWLEACESKSECGGLDCLCGLCTRSCSSDRACGDLGVGAECRPYGACEAVCSAGDDGPRTNDPTEPSATENTDPTPSDDDTEAGSSDDEVPNPEVLACGSEPPMCFDACGATRAPECVNGVWNCPPFGDVLCEETNDAGGGSGGSSGGTGGDTGAGGGSGMLGTGGGGGASDPEDGGTLDPCDTVSDMGPCDVEGIVCGGPCTDPCTFCNLSTCRSGTWQRLEAFPAPCFDCGNQGQRCQLDGTYCDIEGAVAPATDSRAVCEALPEACRETPTCECLQTWDPSATCTEGANGGLILERTAARLAASCSCTVFATSGWCAPGVFADENHPVEWVCGGTPELHAQLLQDCISLPTGAPRWCCPETFNPMCE